MQLTRLFRRCAQDSYLITVIGRDRTHYRRKHESNANARRSGVAGRTVIRWPSNCACPRNAAAQARGLWKQTQYEGQSGSPEEVEIIYQCADEASDKKMQEMAMEMAACTEEPMKRKGNTLVGRNVCTIMGSKVTTDYVITGDLNSKYRIESRSNHDPPLFGQSEGRSVLVAEWQGQCKPGQKPGDMIVQGDDGENTVNMKALPRMAIS